MKRGLMEPDPELPPIEWHRQGVVFLWLFVVVLAFVVLLLEVHAS